MAAEDKVVEELSEGGQLLKIQLNAPKGNVLDTQMIEAVTASLTRHDSASLKAVIFEGAGSHFSFGASVPEHQKSQVRKMLPTFHDLFRLLLKMGVPTFAAVRGQCLGGGLELAGYCSWIMASPTAMFGQPEIKLAVFPPMASLLLPWRLGGARGMDLCVSGRSVNAEEAHRMGLVHSISEDPVAAAIQFAREHLLGSSGSSLRFADRAARLGLARQFIEALPALEELYLDELMETHDANEGITAFLERRKPVYAASKPQSGQSTR
ncbi:MAG: enoyl-CoA hydratase-related protein [Polyangiaceae bacterium]